MKKSVLIIMDTLDMGGAENLATNIAVNLKNGGVYNPVICLTRRGGPLEQKLSENNIKYVILGRKHRYEVHKFYGLKKIIEQENIMIIHAHKMGSNVWAGIAGKIFGIPVITHLHTHPNELGRIGGALITKFIGAMSNKVISVSEYVTNELIEEKILAPSKIVTIHNGIKYRSYMKEPDLKLKNELGINPSSTVIAIVAGFREEKNHGMLLLAARELLDKKIDTVFLLVGDGALRDQLEQKAAELRIDKSVIFTGLRKDIPDLLSIVDIGVLCSLYEGIPLVVLEYMAASKPVISTDLNGVHEIIEDGVNGLFVPLGNPSALANAIVKLTQDKELTDKLVKNGLKTVSEEFSEESMMNKVEELYEQVLEKRF